MINKSYSPADIVIRPANIDRPDEADAAQIARIYNHYVVTGGATFDNVQWPSSRVTALMEIGLPDAFYLADLDNQILGWASARRFSDRHGYLHACETAIYLDPDAIGRSVADLLQQQIEFHCREHGFHHAVAKIIASNQRSLAFHYRHGYELVGVQKEIGFVDNQWVDVAILQRIFD
ncbi:MAG: N-acetyltransferase [Pirellulaceae bacterium]|nr:N-acetyltransferase [Pirellulaceae bacterium]